ncbi:MAG: dTMP kinase [Myxococcales bacterium]|nr:dTMP kinase [Myxococcales bacterium]MCB9669089.1 dTMP kinase [Alphaproteobacteria bacterium]
MKGSFIVLEGLDGAGTTTQARALLAILPPHTLATNEPTAGPIGRVARQSLRGDPEAPPLPALPWLYAADRADHVHREVLPALEAGRTVLSDRYVPSSLAYQSLTHDLQAVWELNHRFPVPDRVFFVDVSVETALGRIQGRGEPAEIYDTEERLRIVRAAYVEVMAFLAERGWPIVHIDGDQPIDAVTAAIVAGLP